jgi:hypothetical protein
MLDWPPLSTLTSRQLFALADEHAAQAMTMETADGREALNLVASRYTTIAIQRAEEEMASMWRYFASSWCASQSSNTFTISANSHRVVVTPAAIAGVQRNV